ncbi:hypothetical protein BpHYR1_048834 [Brachionus plicatilis]|uniref:Reverse transcriptase domain-containing protein n=1 Tax=Brachionus plicatilis TaxID=10195 RepID=A0A3M7S6J3_BRAPC|nr:hypothetical protein BpHYR1_048834 [Brachionus plicatilis]
MNTNLISEIDAIKTGILMYADDLLIMTDCTKKMKKILKFCEDYGLRTEIKFNQYKSQIMRINGSKKDEVKLELGGEEIEWRELKLNDESAFIKELREILGSSDQITKENPIKKKELKKEDFEKSKNGICDSILYCRQNLKERKEELKLLLKTYFPRTEPNAEFV